ncbi:condensation domain-containing protein [Williamsia sp. 1135]|uniref:condensation domain-containing protein n=1 Tax=Williamsia sp. 1135 TaxID=1889262 RepID=UPI000A1177A0|nr:condensation domain-containing protein [Williamsia sp. 1135]ORM35311.1 hypothetical protein BFL43_09615 [Williamsia sp. 1135]
MLRRRDLVGGESLIFRGPILDLGLAIYNVHGGPLPDYRGVPLVAEAYAILNGESRYGAALHRVDGGIDTGPVIDGVSFDLSGDVTLEGLSLDVSEACHELFLGNYAAVLAGTCSAATSLGDGPGHYFGFRQLATIGERSGERDFRRATDLGMLADRYPWYELLFRAARGGRSDLTTMIADVRYWQERLEGVARKAPDPLEPVSPRSTGQVERPMDHVLAEKVREVATERQVSLDAVVHAAVVIASAAIDGGLDLVVGLPTEEEARATPTTGELIPLRYMLRGNSTGAELLADVQRTMTEGLTHTDIPVADFLGLMFGATTSRDIVGVAASVVRTAGVRASSPAVGDSAAGLEFIAHLDEAVLRCSYTDPDVDLATAEMFTRTVASSLEILCDNSTLDVAEVLDRVRMGALGGSEDANDIVDRVVSELLEGARIDTPDPVDLLANSDRLAGIDMSRAARVDRAVAVAGTSVDAVVEAFVRCLIAFGYHPTVAAGDAEVIRAQIHVSEDQAGPDAHVRIGSGLVELWCTTTGGNVAAATVVAAGDLDVGTVEVFARSLELGANAVERGDRVSLRTPDPTELLAGRTDRAESRSILDSDHWIDFVEEYAGRDQDDLGSVGGDGAPVVRRTRVAGHLAAGIPATVAAVLDRVATTVLAERPEAEGVLVDVEESVRGTADVLVAPGRLATRYPVHIGPEHLDTGDEHAGVAERLRAAGVLPTDEQTAADYQLLRHASRHARGMFDEVPDAEVLVQVAHGEARVHLDDQPRSWGGYRLVIAVTIGTESTELVAFGDATVVDDIMAAIERSSGAVENSNCERAERITDAALHVVTIEQAPAPLLDLDASQLRALEEQFGDIADVLPLSALQQGFFFHLGLANEAGITDLYASQARVRVRGALDPDRMRVAVERLLGRNENLKAGFTMVGDRPVQVLPAHVPTPVTAFAVDDYAGTVEDVLERERFRPFIAAEPPLLRFSLVQHAGDEWTIALTFEHILFDGWSLGSVWDELFAFYDDLSGRSLAEAVPFRRYVEWPHVQDHCAALEHWEEQFADGVEPTIVRPDASGRRRGPRWPEMCIDTSIPSSIRKWSQRAESRA